MSRYIKIGQAAKLLGVTPQTVRRWEREGQLSPDRVSEGGTRYYDVTHLLGLRELETDLTVAYARVSSQDQKEDLRRQAENLETYCARKGWRYELIQDLGSGMNYRKKGLKLLLEMILERRVKRVVLTDKDRLLRFGAELVFALCEARNVEVVILNQGGESSFPSFEEELVQDVLEIITVFSARMYGSRAHKNKKLVQAAKVLSE